MLTDHDIQALTDDELGILHNKITEETRRRDILRASHTRLSELLSDYINAGGNINQLFAPEPQEPHPQPLS